MYMHSSITNLICIMMKNDGYTLPPINFKWGIYFDDFYSNERRRKFISGKKKQLKKNRFSQMNETIYGENYK